MTRVARTTTAHRMTTTRDQVLALRAQGMVYREIAARLGISYAYARKCGSSDSSWESYRKASNERKRRSRGICSTCGGETRYDGHNGRRVATRCASCQRQRLHDERFWTREQVVARLQELAAHLGRTPTTTDSHLFHGSPSLAAKLSRARIAEVAAIPSELTPPTPDIVQREIGSWGEALDAAGLARPPRGSASHREVA